MMTLIITYINTGMDSEYINRFLKAWVVSLPIAIAAALFVGPITKNFVDKITNIVTNNEKFNTLINILRLIHFFFNF